MAVIDGKKKSSVSVQLYPLKIFRQYKIVLSVHLTQSVFDPKEIISKSSSSTGSAKVCHR